MQAIFDALVAFFTSTGFGRMVGILVAAVGLLDTLYWVIGFFFTRRFRPAKKQHKYAVCIAARNEESVIGNLLDSIARQDYPAELLTVFVVADNCTDQTAAIAREKGAICYERFHEYNKTKGFALQFLFENIEKDYGTDAFEGYFVFDADNLLKQDYVSRMNDAFDTGLKVITSYRNTKNFDESWVASTYAIHWLRSIRRNHRTRSVLRLATNVQGTGFLFSNLFVRNGWRFTSLTEDRAFTADAVARGYQISYNDEAVFYDEQPTSLKIALRQRLRWSKGHLLAFAETGWALFKNVLFGSRYADAELRKPTRWGRFVESIRHRAASLDTLVQLFPRHIVSLFIWVPVTLLGASILCFFKGFSRTLFSATGSNYLSRLLFAVFGETAVQAAPGLTAVVLSLGVVIGLKLLDRAWQYLKKIPMALYVFLVEHRRIIRIPWYKKVLYCITWPTFDIIQRYTSYVALFVPVTWKPIPHTSKVTIKDVEKNNGGTVLSAAKVTIKRIYPYVLAVLPFVMMDAFIRILATGINYFQPAMILPSILFSVIWVGLMVGVSTSLPKLAGRIVYGLLFTLFFALFLTNSIYYSYTDFFFSFKLLSLAGAGSAYIWDTVKGANPLIYLYCLLVIGAAVTAIIFFPGKKKTWKPLTILVTCALFILLHSITPVLYGKAYDTLQWDAWRNPRNVYNNFNDTNKNVKICGLYEYSFRDFCKSLLASQPQKTPEEVEFLEEVFTETPPHDDNTYTGIFEGKNVIFLQLEGMDTWLLNEETTPTLYKLQQESMNFTQHYSYYTGGGSTFNSELAVNTSFVTPVTFYQNAYTFTNNLYPYSLPKMFKGAGYNVNAFHMNTGEYYSRKLNYLNWGYDNYYGLMDIQNYTDLAYELDRELILNETFYEKMFLQEGPFLHYIITYTPHTPFTTSKGKGEVLAQEKYADGEIPDMTEEDVARLYAGETDHMVQLLLQGLEENGLLENTVIVAYADHYLYTLNDKSILDANGKITENNLINHTPFFIWSYGGEYEAIEKVNSQIDILPTVLNMFGFEHPEQYFVGSDIMCDEYAGYVFFSDYSWYDGSIYVENGEVVIGEDFDSAYVIEMSTLVSELIWKNDLIQKYDHFRELENNK